jgi:hypothetical protein
MLDGEYESLRLERVNRIKKSKPEPVEEGIIHFNETIDIVNANRPLVKDRVISTHLKRLEENKIVIKNRGEPGKKGSYRFTEGAKILNQYGLLNLDFDKKYDDLSKEGKRMILNQTRFNFIQDSIGKNEYIKKKKAEPGDIVEGNEIFELVGKNNSYTMYLKDMTDFYENAAERSKINFKTMNFERTTKDKFIQKIFNIIEKGKNRDIPTREYSDVTKEEMKENEDTVKSCMQACDALIKLNLWKIQLKLNIGPLTQKEMKLFYDTMGQKRTIDLLSNKKNVDQHKRVKDGEQAVIDDTRIELKRRIDDIDKIIKMEQVRFSRNIKKIDRKKDSWSYDICTTVYDLCDPELYPELKPDEVQKFEPQELEN